MTVRRALGVLTTLGLLALSIIRAQPAAAADTCTLDTTTHVLTADVSDTSGIAVTSSTISIGSCGPMDAAQIDVANVTATDADGTAQVGVLLPWPSGPAARCTSTSTSPEGPTRHDTCNGGDGHEDTAKACETVWRVP